MPDLTVYLAGSFASRHQLKEVRSKLQEMGIIVTSSWLDDKRMTSQNEYAVFGRDRADRDFRELNLSKFFIMSWEHHSTTGAMWVELGLAIAMKKIIWVVGYRSENPFTWHREINRFINWEEVYDRMFQLKDVENPPRILAREY